jgi:hypothetical protein
VDEFKVGLKKMGMRPTKDEFDSVIQRLDKDGSGDVSGSEFDKAAKLVIKKAQREGRAGELKTWPWSAEREEVPNATTYNWHLRSLRATDRSTQPGSQTERSWRTERSVRLPKPWSAASSGPHGSVYSTLFGVNSLTRERLFDSACSGAHPTSTKMPKLPLHKTIYKKAVFDGRFEKEPSDVPDPKMLSMRDRCPTATRGKLVRAEPIAALYEQRRVHHIGYFPELESQLCSYTGETKPSPDRLDALVWGISEISRSKGEVNWRIS